MKISSETTPAELGAIICEALKAKEMDAFLSGGSVVSIYTNNRYMSHDLDFVTVESAKKNRRCYDCFGL